MKQFLPAVLVVVVTGCSSAQPAVPAASPGPARIRTAVVEQHARQFGEEVPEREAGSQQEQAASVYILGHLQQAGYVVRLDPVPVADLVRSTNVLALPPEDSRIEAVVAVPYDTAGEDGDGEVALGLFLELARALNAASPSHSVAFVALGAEHATESGGRLGSRRTANLLLDEAPDARVVVLGRIDMTGEIAAKGDDVATIGGRASETRLASATAEVFAAAGFATTTVGGGAPAAGEALLRFLEQAAG